MLQSIPSAPLLSKCTWPKAYGIHELRGMSIKGIFELFNGILARVVPFGRLPVQFHLITHASTGYLNLDTVGPSFLTLVLLKAHLPSAPQAGTQDRPRRPSVVQWMPTPVAPAYRSGSNGCLSQWCRAGKRACPRARPATRNIAGDQVHGTEG